MLTANFLKLVTGPITRTYLIKTGPLFYPLRRLYCLVNLVKMPKVGTTPTKRIQIIPFLRGLLDDDSKKNIICWTDKSNLKFRLLDQQKVAEIWGLTKQRTKVMTYSKMYQALRKRCKNNLLEKVHGRTCEYRFVDPLLFGIDRFLSSEDTVKNRGAKRSRLSSHQLQILSFLHGLLNDPSNKHIICWSDKTKLQFRIIDTKKVGELWGLKNPKGAAMTYDNVYNSLSRLCRNGTLEKSDFRNLEYRFVNSSSLFPEESKKPLLFSVERILSSNFGRSI
ncbi:hypothetical protein B9Z55_016954 [Caenorhabditis nigoni]|uniref:ETS domain-containing protein n=1 Tax=Caenorhabditis nigoni TaxID=1611254 RepID=A0A2G5T7E3_9PELO|nr:hypothetical protein B9Z55_016954 [Caenorhabditis nigoni]